jgi:hypothetical protein
MTCRGTSACPENVVVFVSVWQPAPAKARKPKMLMKPAIRLRLWSLKKNVPARRGALILVEQFHPFIGPLTIRRRSYWQAKLQGLFSLRRESVRDRREIAGAWRPRVPGKRLLAIRELS